MVIAKNKQKNAEKFLCNKTVFRFLTKRTVHVPVSRPPQQQNLAISISPKADAPARFGCPCRGSQARTPDKPLSDIGR